MTPSALVLGPPKFIGPLGVMRSLGRLGVPVYGLAHRHLSMANSSRYCAGTVNIGINGRPLGDPSRLLEEFRDAGRGLGEGCVLIPASDEWAIFVACHADELAGAYVFARNAPDLISTLASKEGLAGLAHDFDLPTPAIHVPRSREDAVAMAASINYPVIIKPVQSRPGMTVKAIANDQRDLLASFDQMADSAQSPNISIQEYIPGSDQQSWLFNGYFDAESRCLAAFTGTKLRQHPRGVGVASLAVTRHNAELIEQSVAFLTGVGYRGPVDIDYRHDARDGLYKVVDVNPRVGGVFRAFVDEAEMDIARAMYLDLTHGEVRVGSARDGRRWVKEDSDLVAFRYYRDAEGLTLRAWIRSLWGVEEGATLSRDDPLPFVVAMVGVAFKTIDGKRRHAGRGLMRALRRILVPRFSSPGRRAA